MKRKLRITIPMEKYRLFCIDHESNPFGIQWMRYEEASW